MNDKEYHIDEIFVEYVDLKIQSVRASGMNKHKANTLMKWIEARVKGWRELRYGKDENVVSAKNDEVA